MSWPFNVPTTIVWVGTARTFKFIISSVIEDMQHMGDERKGFADKWHFFEDTDAMSALGAWMEASMAWLLPAEEPAAGVPTICRLSRDSQDQVSFQR